MVLILQSLLQFIYKVTIRSELGMDRKIKTVVKILTKHTFCLLLRLREVLLDELLVKLKLDILVLQFGITRNKVARFLRKDSRH